MVSTQVLMSIKASFKPWKNVCDCASFQSSSPMSSCRRYTASWLSSSVSQDVVLGKLGKMNQAENAMTTVMAPSMMNTQRQLYCETVKPR